MIFLRLSVSVLILLASLVLTGCNDSNSSLEEIYQEQINTLQKTIQQQQVVIDKLESIAKVPTLVTEDYIPSNQRLWKIKSNDYVIAQNQDWVDNGLVYNICLVENPAKCAKLVQYEGSIKDYLVDHFIEEQQDFMPQEAFNAELEFIKAQDFPNNPILKLSEPFDWYRGSAYYELAFYYAVIGETTFVVHFDHAKGDGFLSSDVETLLPKIFIP